MLGSSEESVGNLNKSDIMKTTIGFLHASEENVIKSQEQNQNSQDNYTENISSAPDSSITRHNERNASLVSKIDQIEKDNTRMTHHVPGFTYIHIN